MYIIVGTEDLGGSEKKKKKKKENKKKEFYACIDFASRQCSSDNAIFSYLSASAFLFLTMDSNTIFIL